MNREAIAQKLSSADPLQIQEGLDALSDRPDWISELQFELFMVKTYEIGRLKRSAKDLYQAKSETLEQF